jgi:hypothetical protein
MSAIDKLSPESALKLARKQLFKKVRANESEYKRKASWLSKLAKALDSTAELMAEFKVELKAVSRNGSRRVVRHRAKRTVKARAAKAPVKKEDAGAEPHNIFLQGLLGAGKAVDRKAVIAALGKKFGYKGHHAGQVLRRFREWGESEGLFTVNIDAKEGTLTRTAGARKSKKSAKAAKKEEKQSSVKAKAALVSLLRRTLMDAEEKWTKNKMIEHFNKRHKVDPDSTRALIAEEKKLGGIKENGGILSLSEA